VARMAAATMKASDASPATLSIAGEVTAGHTPPARLLPGQVIRIMTGAPLPDGADAVERLENIELSGEDRVLVRQPVEPGANIRPAGEDARAGDVILTERTGLQPGAI